MCRWYQLLICVFMLFQLWEKQTNIEVASYFLVTSFVAPKVFCLHCRDVFREASKVIRKERFPGYGRVREHVAWIFTQRKDFKERRVTSSLDPAWLKSSLCNLCLSKGRQVCVCASACPACVRCLLIFQACQHVIQIYTSYCSSRSY